MEQQLKERLVGATVLVVIAIIVIPILLDGPGSGDRAKQRLDLPAASDSERRTVRIPLNGSGETGSDKTGTATTADSQSPDQQRDSVAEQESASREEAQPDPLPATDMTGTVPAESEEPADTRQELEPAEATTDSAAGQPWTVQVGSFGSEKNAGGLVERLRELGYADAYISRYDDGTRIHYRVRVGGFPDRDAAAAKAQEIRDRSGEPARPAQTAGG